MRSEPKKPLIIGHRGASALAPENTFASFKKALDGGADGIEFDVRLAGDGRAVVIHDATLKRTGGINRRVSEMTSAELAGIDVGSWFNDGKKGPHGWDFSDQAVPSLEGVLKFLQDFSGVIYIELKCGDADFAALAAAVCRDADAFPILGRVILKSFRLAAIPEIRRCLPGAATAALFDAGVMKMVRSEEFLPILAGEFGADELSIHHSLATPALMKAADSRGMPVTIWTVDSTKWIARGIDLGLNALITNNPAKLIAKRDGSE